MEGISPRKTQECSTINIPGSWRNECLCSNRRSGSSVTTSTAVCEVPGTWWISTCRSYFDCYLNFFWSWKLWRQYWLTDLFKYEKHDSLRKWLTQKQVVLNVFKKDTMLVLMTEGSYSPLNILLGPDPGMSIHLILTGAWENGYSPLLQTDNIRSRERLIWSNLNN